MELFMANLHSTPDTDQSGTERSLIVGYHPNVFDKSTPHIILSGKWLRAAGFDTGHQVTVNVMKGCIVLMAYKEQEQRLQRFKLSILESASQIQIQSASRVRRCSWGDDMQRKSQPNLPVRTIN